MEVFDLLKHYGEGFETFFIRKKINWTHLLDLKDRDIECTHNITRYLQVNRIACWLRCKGKWVWRHVCLIDMRLLLQ